MVKILHKRGNEAAIQTASPSEIIYTTDTERLFYGGKNSNIELAKRVELNDISTVLLNHVTNFNNPHRVTKADVGLGNVLNVEQATKDELSLHTNNVSVHVSDEERSTWNNKASKTVATTSADGLMSKSDKSKLDSLSNYTHPTTDGNLHVPATGTGNSGKFLKAGATAGSLSWSGVTKADVGLSNVTNVAQATKAEFDTHSTDTTAHITAAERANWSEKATTSYVDAKISALIDNAPEAMNTLSELAAAVQSSDDVLDGLLGTVGSKANQSDLTSHTGNTTVHITTTERNAWNAKASTAAATSTTAGLMSGADKAKLDAIASGANNYVLPVASSSAIGGVKAGTNISIATDGTISATNTTYGLATTEANGLMASGDKQKLNAIESGANKYVLPAPTAITIGGVKAGTNVTIGTDGTISAVDTKYVDATTSVAGLMSTADKTKLNGIDSGAEANQNAFTKVTVGSTTVEADSKTDTLTLTAGSNVTLTADAATDAITISATNTTYGAATTSAAGLMSTTDKAKLDAIAANANNYVLPVASTTVVGGVKAGSNISIAADGTISSANTTYSAATQTVNGLMSSGDKTKLDGIATGANNYSHPSGDGNLHVPATGTNNSGKVLKAGTTAGSLVWGTLAKADVGLANVLNVEQASKSDFDTHKNDTTIHVTGTEKSNWNAKATTAYVDQKISDLINSAPGTLDTLGEIATAIQSTDDALDGMLTTLGGKANQTDLTAHTTNTTAHITASERTAWNGKASTAAATSSANGLMTKEDKAKLDGIASGANNYTLPAPTATTIGGVKAGTNISIATDGTISSTNTTYGSMSVADAEAGTGSTASVITPAVLKAAVLKHNVNTTYGVATTSANGLMSSADKVKLDGVETGANKYTLPVPTATAIGGVKAGTNITISTDGTISSVNTTYGVATTAANGLISKEDKTKLDGIATGANNTTVENVLTSTSTTNALSAAQGLALKTLADGKMRAPSSVNGLDMNNVKQTGVYYGYTMLNGVSGASNKISTFFVLQYSEDWIVQIQLVPAATTIAYMRSYHSGTTWGTWKKMNENEIADVSGLQAILDGKASTAIATTSANGLLSSADKTKLDGIASNANNYSLPAATASALGGVKIGTNITNSSGTISIADATTSVKGVVQLTDGVTSTSTTTAATPASVKTAYDLAASKAGTAAATTTANGLMASTDKSKLDGIAAGAQVNTVTSVAGRTGEVVLSKSDVSLGSVNNYGLASTAEAELGQAANKYMTPELTKAAINSLGLGRNATVIGSTTDWNTITLPGIYSVSSTAAFGANTNSPGTDVYTYGTLIVMKPTADTHGLVQIYVSHKDTESFFYRSAYNNANFRVWQKVETSAMAEARLATHTGNTTVHITASERTAWNAKATTAYVDQKITDLVASAPGTLDTLGEIAAAIQSTDGALDGLISSVNNKANIASPTFTGTPAAPTAAVGTNTTQIATTAFVKSAVDAKTSITGNAATATKLATARTIGTSGAATGTATSFDGSGNITIPITALDPTKITGSVAVAQGGTGRATLTAGQVLVGNGTSAVELRAIDATTGGTASSNSIITSGAVKAGLDLKANKTETPVMVTLDGQLQTTSYRRSVIALVDVTNTNASANSWSTGSIHFHRPNGINGAAQYIFNMEKKYNATHVNVTGMILGGTLSSSIRPCTFTYNGVKYGGIEVFFSEAEYNNIRFIGFTNFGIFGVDYYNTQTSAAINTEINNSIEFESPIRVNTLTINNTPVSIDGHKHEPSAINTSASARFVTDTEKSTWNAKAGTDVASATAKGLMAIADKTKLDGIAAGANNYSLPTASASVLGGVKTGSNISNSSGTISVADATVSTKGVTQLYAGTDSTSTTHAATASAVKAAYDLAAGKAGTGTATTTANGLMAATDKVKLDGIATGANNYTLPVATASVLGGVKSGTNITNSSGTLSVADGTTSAKGVVQLQNTLSTSTTTAATPNAVLYETNKKVNKSGDTMTGSLTAPSFKTGDFEIVFNATTGSLDFMYNG